MQRIDGIARHAHRNGWAVMFESDLSHPPAGWHGDGVLVTMKPIPRLLSFIEEITAAGTPAVNISGSCEDPGLPTVCGDDAEIGRVAAAHFIERRFRNAICFASKNGILQKRRFRAFYEAWTADGTDRPRPETLIWQNAMPTGRNTWTDFSEWLGSKIASFNSPLAVFAYSDHDAARVLAVCRERGIDVPDEVAVLGVDNNPVICTNQTVALSSVNHDLELIGRTGAAMLETLMAGGKAPEKTVRIAPQGITTRRSTDTVASDDPLLGAALSHIRRHLGEPIGAPQIALSLGITRLRLDRLFARRLGISVGREILRQRIVAVKNDLSEGNLTLAEIAAKTGFCNAPHLANTFRKMTGITPAAWRKASAGGP